MPHNPHRIDRMNAHNKYLDICDVLYMGRYLGSVQEK